MRLDFCVQQVFASGGANLPGRADHENLSITRFHFLCDTFDRDVSRTRHKHAFPGRHPLRDDVVNRRRLAGAGGALDFFQSESQSAHRGALRKVGANTFYCLFITLI